jgi:hypothetical protein
MKTNLSRLPLIIAAITFLSITNLYSQVTVGSDIAPSVATLLDLKSEQTEGVINSAFEDINITSRTGGLLLPRVKLVSTTTLEPFLPNNTVDSLKRRLAGLTVYNLYTNLPTLYPAIFTWNGSQWDPAQINNAVSALVITEQPKAFTFNESGHTDSVKALTVTTSGGVPPIKYQWYMSSGYNIHVPIPTILTTTNDINQGSQSPSYTPKSRTVKATTGSKPTDIAANTGLYRFYCVVEDAIGQKVQSNTVEVAVGCGAKNNLGEWLSFMCFNLGAKHNISIYEQINQEFISYTDSIDGRHYHAGNTENDLYGDLFQWGRIADGHEKRDSPIVIYDTTRAIIGNGNRCSTDAQGDPTGSRYPVTQVKPDSTKWFGKFIRGGGTTTNWTPVDQTTADRLWHSGVVYEDPCYRYRPSDGGYQDSWHTGTDGTSADIDACTIPGAGWRLPTQSEWGEIYKSGVFSGSPDVATANSWKYISPGSEKVSSSSYSNQLQYKYDRAGGHRIQPDNATTTLFLPMSGYRSNSNGLLYGQCTIGYYWSSSITGTNAYYLNLYGGLVNPGNSSFRANGYAIRCIKNT